MNGSSVACLALVSLGFSWLAPSVTGQFAVEVRTTSVPPTELPPNWPPSANRLHISGFGDAPDVPAPLGTSVWVVADARNDGLPLFAYTADRQVPLGGVLGGDDVLLKYDLTDGQAPFDIPGRYFSGPILGIPDALRTANFYFLVWGAGHAPATADAVLPGMTFDAFDMGVPTIPPLGNGGLGVSQNLYADRFTVVPEPSALSLLGVAGLMAWAGRLLRPVTR